MSLLKDKGLFYMSILKDIYVYELFTLHMELVWLLNLNLLY